MNPPYNKEKLLDAVDKMGEEFEKPKDNTIKISPRLAGTIAFLDAFNGMGDIPMLKHKDPGGLMRVAKQASRRRPKGKR